MPALPKNMKQHPEGTIDGRAGAYYVSVIDGRRYGLLLGPFQTHREALERVDAVRTYVSDEYARGWFYAYGTARLDPGDANPPGRLNAQLLAA